MVSKRRWQDFPGRFKKEIEGTSAITALGGIAIGIASLSLISGAPAMICSTIGGIITVGSVLYSAKKAIPDRLISPAELLGQTINITALKNLDTLIPIFAIIGPERTGKTTLRNRISLKNEMSERTTSITAQIISLQTSPEKYIAVLDGDGSNYKHQFELIEYCDHVIVILDHNQSDVDQKTNIDRIKRHTEFLDQTLNSIKEYRKNKLLSVTFLWNKRDIWSRANNESKISFSEYRTKVIEAWKVRDLAYEINSLEHSNNIPADIAKIMDTIKSKTLRALEAAK